MTTYTIVFKGGVTEEIKAGSIELNDVLDQVKVMDAEGKKMEEIYLNYEDISAVIPQN